MNKGVKFPVKKLYRISEPQNEGIDRVSAHLTAQLGHSISENEVVRRLITHGLTCDIFLTSVSIDRKLLADLKLD